MKFHLNKNIKGPYNINSAHTDQQLNMILSSLQTGYAFMYVHKHIHIWKEKRGGIGESERGIYEAVCHTNAKV